jgi:hypothetical protein
MCIDKGDVDFMIFTKGVDRAIHVALVGVGALDCTLNVRIDTLSWLRLSLYSS